MKKMFKSKRGKGGSSRALLGDQNSVSEKNSNHRSKKLTSASSSSSRKLRASKSDSNNSHSHSHLKQGTSGTTSATGDDPTGSTGDVELTASALQSPEENKPPSSIIDDSTVTVNLAMADLMAYLQVVANNSSNLPLTRRDDPELGRTVSNLTADEYSKKSSAFIPSDVRIISGSFTKYGKVWDLPTSEEFMPSDSTQEPGISQGGACCNAMLKVLYDMEIDNLDSAQIDYNNNAILFDDDDEDLDESPMKSVVTTGSSNDLDSIPFPSKNLSFESLVLNDFNSPASITWTDLLRKMKLEMQSTGYYQAPFLSSSRKFDLGAPFSLIPPNFDKTINKKRSLLIGCNYKSNPDCELKASHDDVRSMKDYIVNVHGFPDTKGLMTILMDDEVHKSPTHMNITEAFKALSEQSHPGDAVFVQFSGHGCRVLDAPIDADVESYDEAIIPEDYSSSGMIRDTLIFKTLLAPMRHGVTVTILLDCCDTGMAVDLPYSWSTKNERSDVLPKMSLNDDFSFVRFLKVIKTLYESSTFTQLGKTVRSAIYDKTPPVVASQDMADDEDNSHPDDSTYGVGSLVTMDENETLLGDIEEDNEDAVYAKSNGSSNVTNSLMTVLNACHSPHDASPARNISENYTDNTYSNTRGGETKTQNTTETHQGQSLFQQVINCTLMNNPAESDDDSYHRNGTFDTDDDYDSYTEEGIGALSAREYARRVGRVGVRRDGY